MLMRFSDGVEIDTGGEPRILELADGLYVTGKGVLIPVKDREEAEQTIRDMKERANDR